MPLEDSLIDLTKQPVGQAQPEERKRRRYLFPVLFIALLAIGIAAFTKRATRGKGDGLTTITTLPMEKDKNYSSDNTDNYSNQVPTTIGTEPTLETNPTSDQANADQQYAEESPIKNQSRSYDESYGSISDPPPLKTSTVQKKDETPTYSRSSTYEPYFEEVQRKISGKSFLKVGTPKSADAAIALRDRIASALDYSKYQVSFVPDRQMRYGYQVIIHGFRSYAQLERDYFTITSELSKIGISEQQLQADTYEP